jgi:hypothetical protein
LKGPQFAAWAPAADSQLIATKTRAAAAPTRPIANREARTVEPGISHPLQRPAAAVPQPDDKQVNHDLTEHAMKRL